MLLAKIVILYPVILKTKCLNKICSCLQMPNNIHLQNVIMTRSHMYFLIYIWWDVARWFGHICMSLPALFLPCSFFFCFSPFAVPNYWCMMSLPAPSPFFFFFFNNIKSLLWDTVLQVTPKMLYTGLVWVSC